MWEDSEEVWVSVLGCGERYKRRCGEVLGEVRGVEKCWGRCGKVCWGVRKVRGDVGRLGRGVGKCVRLWGKV